MVRAVFLFFFLVCLVVFGALYLLNPSAFDRVLDKAPALRAVLPQVKGAAAVAPAVVAPVPKKVNRCESDGKTIYTDEPCPKGTTGREVKIQPSTGSSAKP